MMQNDESWLKEIKQGVLVKQLPSWEDFIDFVKDPKKCWPTLILRGQANSEWPLFSRLDRLEKRYPTKPNLSGGEFPVTRIDREIHLKRFKELALDKIRNTLSKKDISKDEDVLETIAQHHGLATSLLDWTYSPFVALFFAFEEEKCDCDGEFKEPDNRVAFALTHHLVDKSGNVDEAKSKPIKELVQPFSAPGYGNYRAVSQAGVFLKMPKGKNLESYVREHFEDETYPEKEPPAENANLHPSAVLTKLIIPNKKEERIKKEERVECLRFLDHMNINRATLFPDLDGVAKYVNDLWEVNFDKALGYMKQL